MSNVGYETWFEKSQCNTIFVVKNIAPRGKTIKLFQVPIKNNCEYDLLAIKYVSEADIRHSLLKGDLNIKIKTGEIVITHSNIDLLQFDDAQKSFLMNAGVVDGLSVNGGTGTLPVVFKQAVHLVGVLDGVNRIFTIPSPDKFVNGVLLNNEFNIILMHNGKRLEEGIDFIVSESGGAGTGYDTVIFTAFAPTDRSRILADYVVKV